MKKRTTAKKKPAKSRALKVGGVPGYISGCPKDAQAHLKEMRAAVREAAPGAIETLSYFAMPGYAYEGYDYSGMFAWFSFKAPFVRLHVRPQALVAHKKDLSGYAKTTAIVSFSLDEKLPKALIKKLVKASVKAMKDGAK